MAEEEKAVEVSPENGEVQDEKSYDDMTLEELDAEMIRTRGFVEEEPEAEPDPIAADQPEPQESATTDADESPTAEVTEAPAEPDLPDETELQLQELQLRLEKAEASRQQFEIMAGRNAGELGHLKRQLQQATERRPAPMDDSLDDYPAESASVQPQRVVPSGLEEEVAELRAAQAQQSTERIYNEFLNHIATDLTRQGVKQEEIESEQNKILEQITPTMKERFEPFGDLSQMKQKTVEKATRLVLQSAYNDVKLAKVAELRRTVAERKATQIAENKIVKQAASPSGSGGRSVQEPPPKRPEDMTAEEADAALIAEYGDGRYIRPRR